MKVTDQIKIAYQTGVGHVDGLQAVLDYLAEKGLLVEPFDPDNWDGVTEPPVGYRVVDTEADIWCHGEHGWGMKGDAAWSGATSWSHFSSEYGPMALVPGGPVPEADR